MHDDKCRYSQVWQWFVKSPQLRFNDQWVLRPEKVLGRNCVVLAPQAYYRSRIRLGLSWYSIELVRQQTKVYACVCFVAWRNSAPKALGQEVTKSAKSEKCTCCESEWAGGKLQLFCAVRQQKRKKTKLHAFRRRLTVVFLVQIWVSRVKIRCWIQSSVWTGFPASECWYILTRLCIQLIIPAKSDLQFGIYTEFGVIDKWSVYVWTSLWFGMALRAGSHDADHPKFQTTCKLVHRSFIMSVLSEYNPKTLHGFRICFQKHCSNYGQTTLIGIRDQVRFTLRFCEYVLLFCVIYLLFYYHIILR